MAMLRGQAILVVVPARGGSKGIPKKNLQRLAGRPLVAHVGECLRQLAYIDRAILSTDDPDIAQVGRASGLDAPFMRPHALAGDLIGDAPVLEHALIEVERLDQRRYDVIVMLQPTCPLRRPEHVTVTVDTLIEGGWDAVWTVSETDAKYHPLKQITMDREGYVRLFDERGRGIVARQQLERVYYRNGAAYAMTRACLLEQRTTLGARSSAVILRDALLSIDTMEDLGTVEGWFKRREAMADAG